jgi:hypothetical protein
MNLDSSSQRSTPNVEPVIDLQSEPSSLEKAESLAQAMLVRQLEQLTAQTMYVRWTLEMLIALGPSTQKRMQLLLPPRLEQVQTELNYLLHMLRAENAPSLSSMLASDESYSAPYTGPGSARPFSGKLESK